MRRGVAMLGMVVVTVMWSSAGVVTRQLEHAASFETTFWRSLFNAAALLLGLSLFRGGMLLKGWRHLGWRLWASGLCWAFMFTSFMCAITLTTVANVLVTMALSPLFTAVLGWVLLRTPVSRSTQLAMLGAGMGLVIMFAQGLQVHSLRHVLGTSLALLVPLSASLNWVLLKSQHGGEPALAQGDVIQTVAEGASLAQARWVPAILIGAVLSALFTGPMAMPFQASAADLAWLAGLGVFQLAIPCGLVVVLTAHLEAHEVALLSLLEVIFGVTAAWLWASEPLAPAQWLGGGLVLASMAWHALQPQPEARHGGRGMVSGSSGAQP